jgi:hypothetical protein
MTYKSARWASSDHIGVLLSNEGDPDLYVDSGPLYENALAGKYGDIGDPVVIASPGPSIEEMRASMSCTPAQMRLTLHRAGLLATVQAIADSNPEASIVWEYATVIQRNSPFIDALAGDQFTPEQIDDLFRVASNV